MRQLKPALEPRLMRLVEAFEGSADGNAAGNFDGQLLSWGTFHWNFGQGTLLNLLLDIIENGAEVDLRPFNQVPRNTRITLAWLRNNGVLDAGGAVTPGWAGRFRALYADPVAQQMMALHAQPYFRRARQLAVAFGFDTERAFALCLDIVVQNGGIDLSKFNGYLRFLEAHQAVAEWERLKALAFGVAEGSNPRWIEDVRSRKLTIAVGSGTVHGRAYDLAEGFGIRYWNDSGEFATWYEEG